MSAVLEIRFTRNGAGRAAYRRWSGGGQWRRMPYAVAAKAVKDGCWISWVRTGDRVAMREFAVRVVATEQVDDRR